MAPRVRAVETFRVGRLSGQVLELDVDPACSVQKFAQRVAELFNQPPSSLRLAQNGQLIPKGDAMADHLQGQITAVFVPISEYGLGSGDLCETLHPVTVRVSESFDSEVLAELQEGTPLQVLDVGAGRRLMVAGGDAQGWISYKTRRNEPLVARRAVTESAVSELEIGLQYQLYRKVKLAPCDPTTNPEAVRLAAGTRVMLLEVGPHDPAGAETGPHCAKVVVSGVSDHLGTEGWLPLSDIQGARQVLSLVPRWTARERWYLLGGRSPPTCLRSMASLLRRVFSLHPRAFRRAAQELERPAPALGAPAAPGPGRAEFAAAPKAAAEAGVAARPA